MKRPWYVRNVWSDYQETNIIVLTLQLICAAGIIGLVGFVHIFKLV
jgi:hypothetical protein